LAAEIVPGIHLGRARRLAEEGVQIAQQRRDVDPRPDVGRLGATIVSVPTIVGLVTQCRGSIPSFARVPPPDPADEKLEAIFWTSPAGSL
jgi:hypothetical protein